MTVRRGLCVMKSKILAEGRSKIPQKRMKK